ncbi:MAG: transcriptional regulator [Parvularculaceae bacterium]
MTGADEFDYRRIDDVIHGRVRLAIMAFLSGAGGADFSELKTRLRVTDGNLSVHLRKLEEAGYVEVKKTFAGRKPRTICRISQKGAEAWAAYVKSLEGLLGG